MCLTLLHIYCLQSISNPIGLDVYDVEMKCIDTTLVLYLHIQTNKMRNQMDIYIYKLQWSSKILSPRKPQHVCTVQQRCRWLIKREIDLHRWAILLLFSCKQPVAAHTHISMCTCVSVWCVFVWHLLFFYRRIECEWAPNAKSFIEIKYDYFYCCTNEYLFTAHPFEPLLNYYIWPPADE